MEKPELSLCPYCGSNVKVLHDEICYFIWCNNEYCPRKIIKCFATEEEAIEDWERECEKRESIGKV